MTSRYHFISGLPRAGSTLLAAILGQNPRFHAGMSSPVAALFGGVMGPMGPFSEFGTFFDDAKRQRVVRGLFDAYYEDQADKDIIIDTSRAWCGRLDALSTLFPEAKVLCCMRSVAWVLDSLERLARRNPFHFVRFFNNDSERGNVYMRVETLTKGDRMVGHAFNAAKEAFYGEHADRCLFIDYDHMVALPKETVDLVYQFLGEPPFEHDFEHVEYDNPEFDAWLGTEGLHRVSGRIEPRPRKTILPPELFQKYDNMSFWRDPTGTNAKVITPVAEQHEPTSTSVDRILRE